ncbi:hypothetical protein QJS04_geneDACA021322 [Acorus gramineus]|uniref:Uncharacterized protein n=1 Tax=Acorus gramineus TaxID=55184 RepID=A0AAV9AKL5_ACOGR|nr:hypothetical protein QJS04_geneDACA021322 [Acorus gramineus]
MKLAKSDSERKVFHFLFSQVVWSIWKERNDRVFRSTSKHKTLIVRQIIQATIHRFKDQLFDDPNSPLASKFQSLFRIPYQEKPLVNKWVHWIPPLDGWLKANSDGSLSENQYGLGALVRDHKGGC